MTGIEGLEIIKDKDYVDNIQALMSFQLMSLM